MKNINLSTNKTEIDNDIIYYDYKNLESKKVYMNYETEKSFIQFHFCLKGELVLSIIMVLMHSLFNKAISFFYTTQL